MMHPYVLEPKLTFTVGLYNKPKKYADQESPIGEVIGSNNEGLREVQVGNAQAWYYPADKTIVLWECFFDDRFRKFPLLEDTNMQKLWQSFEHYLLKKFRLSGILRSAKLLYYQMLISTYRRSNILRSESSGAPDF